MLPHLRITKFAPLILGLLSLPLPSQQDPVPPSGDPTIPFQIFASTSHGAVNANNLTFWIGKPTTSSCPLTNQTQCPGPGENGVTAFITDGNYLVSSSFAHQLDSKISFLNSAANLLYVSANGALGFTAPNATAYPAGFIQGAFTATFDTSPDGSGRFYFLELTSTEEVTALDWLACPISKKGPWQVFVDFEWLADDDVPGNCVEECEKFNATTIVKYPLVSGEQWVYQYD